MRTTGLEWRRSQWFNTSLLAGVVLALLAGLLVWTPVAHAATITVAAGEVAIAANGQCSLIEAIINANTDAAIHADCAAGSGPDTITLPAASTFTITGSHAYYQGNTGLPQITSVITIDGNNSTLTRGGAAGVVRFLALTSGSNLTINDLTLDGGQATSDVGGGAIYNNNATLTVNDSTFTGNSATGSGLGGGAILANAGTTTVNRSTFTNNQAGNSGGGGGIYANNGATVIVTDSTFSQNTAANTNGGAISAGYSGANNITVSGSTLNGNSANGGGAVHAGAGTFTMNNSTVSSNSSLTAGGGGLYNNGSIMTLNNTTVTGNTTTGSGGGILHNSSQLHLNRSIIAGNSSSCGWDCGYEVTAWSGLISNNYNVFGRSGITNSRAFNGFTPAGTNFNATDGGTPTALASILNTTLAGNGGPTQTHALVANSPAIDRGPSADCTAAPINGVDQRGSPRNIDGNAAASANECDSGAYEYSPPPPPTGTIEIVKSATPADDTLFGFTHTIDLSGPFDLQDPTADTKTFIDVPVGSYTVTEDGESGWTLDAITCTDPTQNSSGNIQTRAATIDLAAGETVTCTFSNSRDTGTVTISKRALPADDTPFDFTHDLDATGAFTLMDPSDNTSQTFVVPTGTYKVTETPDPAWFFFSVYCDGNTDFDTDVDFQTGELTLGVDKGENIHCRFDNDRNEGTIIIKKAATPADDTLFGFTHDIDLTGPFNLQDPSAGTKTFTDVPLGSYTVTEDLVPGWAVDTITCNDSNSTGNPATRQATINLDARNETVTCTFTNVYTPPPASTCPAEYESNQWTDVLGIGMGNMNKHKVMAKVVVPNWLQTVDLYAQLVAKNTGAANYVRFLYPGTGNYVQVNAITSAPDPAHSAGTYWYGADLDPAAHIRGRWFLQATGIKNHIPRALVLYPTYASPTNTYVNVWETYDATEAEVNWNTAGGWVAKREITVPIAAPLGETDFHVELALVDNDQDKRPVWVTVTAGGVSLTQKPLGPNKAPLLNLLVFDLKDVPAGTDEIVIEVYSPSLALDGIVGDSAALVGMAANYQCEPLTN